MLSICYELAILLVLIEIKEVNHSYLKETYNIISIHVYITSMAQTTNIIEIEEEEKEL